MGLRRMLMGPSPGEMVAETLAFRVEPEPLEGTRMDLFNSIIPNWYSENGMSDSASWMVGTPRLADQVWVANRCIQLNAQQIAAMPLEFHASPGTLEPAWVSSPDPHWYPNGIGDAIHSIVAQLYGWGFSCQWITSEYADGFPRTWTVLPSSSLSITVEDGERVYRLGAGSDPLDASRIVQIDRNPGTAAKGTPALAAYAQVAWGLLAAGNQAMSVTSGGTPKFYLKSERKLNKAQAEDLQLQWMTAAGSRNGAPPVVPPEITPTEMSFDPSELALLDTQEFDVRVLATAYGVPSVILNMALQGGLTYQNPLALMQMWWLTELRTTAKRIVDAFTAQMLPRGQWVSVDASDITQEATPDSDADDPQLSQVAKASPAQQPRPLTAIGGGSP